MTRSSLLRKSFHIGRCRFAHIREAGRSRGSSAQPQPVERSFVTTTVKIPFQQPLEDRARRRHLREQRQARPELHIVRRFENACGGIVSVQGSERFGHIRAGAHRARDGQDRPALPRDRKCQSVSTSHWRRAPTVAGIRTTSSANACNRCGSQRAPARARRAIALRRNAAVRKGHAPSLSPQNPWNGAGPATVSAPCWPTHGARWEGKSLHPESPREIRATSFRHRRGRLSHTTMRSSPPMPRLLWIPQMARLIGPSLLPLVRVPASSRMKVPPSPLM